MALEFIDEAPPASAGVQWLDEPAPAGGGVEFTGEEQPADEREIVRRVKDISYDPTPAEFAIYQKAQKARGATDVAGDFLNTAGEVMSGLWDTAVRAVKALPALVTDEQSDPLFTAAEGLARGTRRDLLLGRRLMQQVLETDHLPITAASQKFILQKTREWRGGDVISDPAKPLPLPPAEKLAEWRKEFERDRLPDLEYGIFMDRRSKLRLEQSPEGRVSVITGKEAPINPDLAEAQSLVTSPLMLVPMGKAMTPLKTASRAAASKVLAGAGKTFEWVGEKTVQAGTLPERGAGALARVVTGSDDAAAKATEQVAQGVAGISMLPVKAAGKTTKAAGQAAEAVGRQINEGPSRYGLFARVARDPEAPEWMRRAANAVKSSDPAVSLAGAAAKGASEGATIGVALGGAADGEEGAAAGLGAGVFLGGVGAGAGRLLGRGKYQQGLKQMDLAAWLATKSQAEIENIKAMKLNPDQALGMADLERLARGTRPEGQAGDVEFHYVSDREFTEIFGVGRGAQVVQGDRPVVFINTGYKGGRSMPHEVAHALDALDGFAPQRQALNRILFDQTAGDGTPISRGLYTTADVAEFSSQYRQRLPEAARSEFDLLTPEARQQRILSEVRAESMANLIAGRPGSAFNGRLNSIRTRVADALLLADHQTMLGKLRRGLEAAGVKFQASGDPSELFVRNGKPVTNSPQVDAALRDYLRAKDRITRRLTAGEDGEEPTLVVRPADLVSRGNSGLIDTFRDNDIFARNADGTVKMLGGVPMLLSEREIRAVQTKRVEAMLSALDAVPDTGEAGAVRRKDNGAYEGRHYTDAQLEALEALPGDLLSPSMKAKLRQLNGLAMEDGAQVIMDYNAALKSGRYSSGIGVTTRAAVPLSFHISKAGNFYMNTLDTTHFFRKLAEWRKSKPRAFEAWGGDADAFLRDAFTYLDNHVNGRAGSVNLDGDAAAAVHKRNVINDFFNVPKGVGNEHLNPVQLSTQGNKDNLIRSRRFDRINRITEGAGDRFPVRYELQKVNFMPGQGDATPQQVKKHVAAQVKHDFSRQFGGPENVSRIMADQFSGMADRNPVVALEKMNQPEMGRLRRALITGGWSGARNALKQALETP